MPRMAMRVALIGGDADGNCVFTYICGWLNDDYANDMHGNDDNRNNDADANDGDYDDNGNITGDDGGGVGKHIGNDNL